MIIKFDPNRYIWFTYLLLQQKIFILEHLDGSFLSIYEFLHEIKRLEVNNS